MQSILFLVYILIPLTTAVRNYQNSMIGMFNSGVPRVPNSHNIYELYNNGKKKGRHVIFQKVNGDETPPEESIENQDSNHREIAAELDLRRQNSASTEQPKLNLDFPIPGAHVSEYNPYPTLLRQGPNGEEGINIDAPLSSESFGQYFPVPPLPQGRVENDMFIPRRGEKDMFLPRGENDDIIAQSKEYSYPQIERVVREKYNREMGGYNGYNGGSNGFNGGNNGNNGENNDYNQDMDEINKVLKALTPTEKSWALIGASLNQGSKQQKLLEAYKRITNTLNGKEKGPLGYIGGSNGVDEGTLVGHNEFDVASNGFNVGSKGFHGGSNGFNGGSDGFNEESNGFNGGSNGFKVGDIEEGTLVGYNEFNEASNGFNVGSKGFHGGSNVFNGGSNGFNGGSNGFNEESNGLNGGYDGFKGNKAVRQGYNIQYTGMKARNKGNNGQNDNIGENFDYYNDTLAYTKRIKALPPPEKTWGWTSKSLTINPEQQELVDQYKRVLNMFNEVTGKQ